jgi:hypothetical protein
VSSPPPAAAAGNDTLRQGESLTAGATLVSSPTGVFELGFHAPDPNRPARLYLCIWYRAVRPRTVAWVANRAAPATSSSPSLTLTSSGELRVLDGAALLWSSNTTTRAAPRGGYAAVLLDSGSLQVRDEDGNELWDSFWHPSDTMLSGMRITVKAQGRGPAERMLFTSWASDTDPSPGRYALGLDPVNPSQAYIWKDGNVPIWRSVSLLSLSLSLWKYFSYLVNEFMR